MTATRDTDDHWSAHAKCGKYNGPASWDLATAKAKQDEGKLTEDNRRAIDICIGCPVTRACFDEALKRGDAGQIRAGIPLWKPMERYRCATCREVGLRVVTAGRTQRRRTCDECLRLGVVLRRRKQAAVAA